MTIGLPRAFLYYKYRYLWETFFETLGCEVIVSKETDRRILADGIRYSIDESCLPSKIYMGHVHSLIGKCDYILVPRVDNFGKDEKVCVKFNAMYDIVNNTFENVNLLDYNLDIENGMTEKKGFLEMGRRIGKNRLQTMRAYKTAKRKQSQEQNEAIRSQEILLQDEEAPKILVVSHPYNVYDQLIGVPIIEQIKKLGGTPLFADVVNTEESKQKAKEMSKCLYWTYNKELLGAINIYQDKIDGIILLTAFPCGPDSLVNELILRTQKTTPVINIVLDELQGEAGMQTRIESFMDIIIERKRK